MLAVALAAGCGGGGSSNDKLTRHEFAQKADAICADYNEQTAKLENPKSYDEIVAYAQKLEQLAGDAVGKFKALNPPDDERANWKAFARNGDQLVAAAKQLEQAGKKKDTAALARILTQSRKRSDESHRIGAAMGAPACAQT